ncbi:MAG: hypothetical protein ACD_11C00004G0033 [uncultured bacterium]|nr:MAG: hypothetical protein ACD_11C00004G0033 [uncultured bacterium]HBR71666.1 hypothetical protein [Candidatus Moranbacteria bacterium]
MKRSVFVSLVFLQAILVIIVGLVFFAQYYLYSENLVKNIVRFYAMFFFLPNMIGMGILYLLYAFGFVKRILNKDNIDKFKLHIFYNALFWAGISASIVGFRNVVLEDSFFILLEGLSICAALCIIFKSDLKSITKQQ